MPDHSPYKDDGWNEYRRLVTGSLDELNKDLKELEQKLDINTQALQDKLTRMDKNVAIALTKLQDKSRMWGAIAGTIGGAIISALVVKLIR